MDAGKQKIIFGLIFLIVVVLIGFISQSGTNNVLGETPELVVYSGTGKAILYVPFIMDRNESFFLDVYIDQDSDKAITETEQVVSRMRAHPDEGWRNGYAIPISQELGENVFVKIVLSSGEVFEGNAQVTSYNPKTLVNFENATDLNNAMKQGGGGAPAPVRPSTPDITQRFAECGPTAAANSLISLAQQHGKKLSDLPSQTDMINGLKAEMDWTPENGVSPDKFVEGKDKYMAKLGLPIRTTLAGGDDGRGTINELRDALRDGRATEVQLKFHDPETGAGKGSHVLTVVGVEEVDGKTLVKVHDPNTPSGTEIYDVTTGEVLNYPSEWSVTFGWGFVQTWEGTPSGDALEPMTDAEITGIQEFVGEKEMIEVIEYQGEHIPVAVLHIGKPHAKHATGEGCDQTHWHADREVQSIEGKAYTDPNPGACGFGKTSQVKVVSVEKP